MSESIRILKVSIAMILLLTILTGIIYPLCVTGLAQILFPWAANGSLITRDDDVIGSELIGQAFTAPQYFWSRPSATSPYPYNAEASGGSNLGPSNKQYLEDVKNRIAVLLAADMTNPAQLIPVDLVTTSASGLDPEISPVAAYYQVHRIAKVRKLSEADVNKLIQSKIQFRWLGLFGEQRLNVLDLNLALDALDKNRASM